jgi:hypothetical protein
MKSRTLSRPFALAPVLLALGLAAASTAEASPIVTTAGAVGLQTIAPSADSISLNAGSSSLSAGTGVAFQTGDFLIGNSPIPDQNISFTLSDTLTINGVTQTITIDAVDEVTTVLDTLVISAGTPTVFGTVSFTLDPLTLTGNAVGEDVSIRLAADLANVPEPGTLALFGSALIGLGILRRRKTADAPVSRTFF